MPLKNRKQRTGEAGDQGVPARAVAGENYILGWTDFFLPVWFGEVSITNSLGGREHCHCPHCPAPRHGNRGTCTLPEHAAVAGSICLVPRFLIPQPSAAGCSHQNESGPPNVGRHDLLTLTLVFLLPWERCWHAGRWARPPGRAFPWTCFLQDCEEIPSLLLPLPPHMRSQHSLCYVTQSGVHQTY